MLVQEVAIAARFTGKDNRLESGKKNEEEPITVNDVEDLSEMSGYPSRFRRTTRRVDLATNPM